MAKPARSGTVIHSLSLMLRAAGLLSVGCFLCVFARAQSPFTFDVIRTDLVQINHGGLAYADVDYDGDFDVVASGNRANRPPYVPYSFVAISGGDYLLGGNTPAHLFSARSVGEGLRFGKAVWSDYDRDGKLDFFMSGTAHSGAAFDTRPQVGTLRLYRNQGNQSFNSVNTGMKGLYGGVLEVADFDGDGDEDVFVSGYASALQIEAGLYQNNRGRFTLVTAPFEPLALGDGGWVDFDTDGDLDFMLSGVSETGRFYTRLYRNIGSGRFSQVNVDLPGLAFSSFDWGDYDNDGDPDLVLSGGVIDLDKYLKPVIQIWRNDDGQLALTGHTLNAILYGQVAWGDYDSDGMLDLLVVGATDIESARRGRIYRNEGGRFADRVALPGVASAAVAWGDYDQDKDPDILITGTNLSFNPLTRLYRNESRAVNTVPSGSFGVARCSRGSRCKFDVGGGQRPADAC